LGRKSREKQARRDTERENAERLTTDSERRAQLLARLTAGDVASSAFRAACEEVAFEAERLRCAGALTEALDLASAGGRRTAKLATEEALAAFALGLDDRAESAASGVPETRSFLAPLLAAARGESVRASKRVSALAREAIQCAKVLAAIRTGDARKAERERSATIDAQLAPPLLAAASSAEVAARSSPHEWSPLWTDVPPAISEQAAATIGARHSRDVLSFALEVPERWAAIACASALGSRAAEGHADGVRLAELLARLGPSVVPEAQRATGALYASFGVLATSPEQALVLLESALGRGADLAECLRGMWLAEDQLERPGRAAKHALRLSRHLAATPGGVEMAIAACVEAARLLASSAGARVREALDLGLGLAQRAGLAEGTVGRQLQVAEALSMVSSAPEAARKIIEDVLKDDPKLVSAWEVLLDLERDPTASLALLTRAVEATAHPDFEAQARALGGPTTCGAVAAAIARAWSAAPKSGELTLSAELAASQARLAPPDRDAVEVAMIALMMALDRTDRALARALAARERGDPWWTAAASLLMRKGEVIADRWWEVLSAAHGATSAFEVLFELAIDGSARPAAARLLSRGAHLLSADAVKRAKRALGRVRPGELSGQIGSIHDRLHPELCLLRPLERQDAPEPPGLDMMKMLSEVLDQQGIPPPRGRW